jgi:hypothetical protein
VFALRGRCRLTPPLGLSLQVSLLPSAAAESLHVFLPEEEEEEEEEGEGEEERKRR